MCIFCKIINSEAPSYTVYEDKCTIGFLDINPVNDSNVLCARQSFALVPKQDIECKAKRQENHLNT